MIKIFKKSDPLPPLPLELDKTSYIGWGELLVDRSTEFADQNRFAALYIRPSVTFLTSMTAAAGAAVTISSWFGLVVVVLSAAAASLNALFSWSPPEQLYLIDRLQQAKLWQELNHFKANLKIYEGKEESEACRHFAERMTELTHTQIKRWAERGESLRDAADRSDASEGSTADGGTITPSAAHQPT